MLQDLIRKGATDKSVRLKIIDSADGTPETGVVFNTSGIDLWYRRELEAKTSITEATLAALTTAHADGGFLHISDGVYRLDLPDAAFASGANYVEFGGTVTGMVVIGGVVKLIDSDLFNDTVRGGFTALPNAAADAAGGLPISDAGGLDLDIKLANTNEVTAARMAALTDWINGGRLDLILDIIAADTTTDIPALIATLQTAADAILVDTGTTLDGRIPAALVSGRMDSSVGAMAVNVMTAAAAAADLTTELQTGLATAAALATVDGIVDDILVDTAVIGALGAGLTALSTQASVDDLPTNAELSTALGTADDAALAQIALVKAQTDLIPAAPAAVGNIPTAIENADALLKRDLSAVTGEAARSPLNALRFQRNKFTIAGGLLTVYREDDTTVAWTAVLTQTAGDPVSASDPA